MDYVEPAQVRDVVGLFIYTVSPKKARLCLAVTLTNTNHAIRRFLVLRSTS